MNMNMLLLIPKNSHYICPYGCRAFEKEIERFYFYETSTKFPTLTIQSYKLTTLITSESQTRDLSFFNINSHYLDLSFPMWDLNRGTHVFPQVSSHTNAFATGFPLWIEPSRFCFWHLPKSFKIKLMLDESSLYSKHIEYISNVGLELLSQQSQCVIHTRNFLVTNLPLCHMDWADEIKLQTLHLKPRLKFEKAQFKNRQDIGPAFEPNVILT